MKLLQQISSVLSKGRRSALKSLINSEIKAGMVSNSGEAKELLATLIKRIAKSTLEPITKFREAIPGERISSEDWNDTQKELYVDMFALYSELNQVDKIASTSFASNLADFTQSKASIIKSLNEIEKYQFLKDNPQYQDLKYIDFSDARNATKRQPKAIVDTDVRKLELGERSRARVQDKRTGESETVVTIKNLGGGITNNLDQSFDTDNMLDNDPRTFWAQLVLTDEVVKHTYQTTSDAGLGTSYTSNGAIGEIEIQFPKTSKVNNISILPFAPYPVRIVDLAYKQNPSESTYRTVPGFTVKEPTLDWYEISFRPVAMSNLIIVLEQENYDKNIYHLPANIVHNQMLWSQIAQSEYDDSMFDFKLDDMNYGVIKAEPEKLAFLNAVHMVSEEIRYMHFQDVKQKDQYKNMQNFTDAMTSILHKIALPKSKSIASLMGSDQPDKPNTPETIEVKKFEYIYGIRSIDISYVRYQPVSYYESPKFNSNATITEIQLEATEIHPEFNDGYTKFNRTSIEYELEFADNTRIPILPDSAPRISTVQGISGYKVKDEYLKIPRADEYGYTRFKPLQGSAVVIRKNGMRILLSEYTFDTSGSFGKLTIVNNFDSNAIYTIDYWVLPSAVTVNALKVFDSKEFSDGETFTETNTNNAIRLSYYPYTEYEIINNASSWTKLDGESDKWIFEPTKPNYMAGTVATTNSDTAVTGYLTDFTSNIDTSIGVTNYFRVKNETETYQIESITNATSMTLASNYAGSTNSSTEYQAGQSYYVDGRRFYFQDNTYEPTRVFVNDVKAFNLTDFEKLENPAFVDDNAVGLEYQYIQAGPFIYFSKPIKQSNIKVFYRWLTQYVKVNITMRCNVNIVTDITPKVDNIKVKIKNTKL